MQEDGAEQVNGGGADGWVGGREGLLDVVDVRFDADQEAEGLDGLVQPL